MTVGGGEVIDVSPRYHRRFQKNILQYLEQLSRATPEELVLAVLDVHSTRGHSGTAQGVQGYELAAIARQCNMSNDVTRQVLETLITEGRARLVGEHWFAEHIWQALADEAVALVQAYHVQYALRSGLSKEEWRARLHLSPKLATDLFAVLQNEKRLQTVETEPNSAASPAVRQTGTFICLPTFVPRFTAMQQQQVESLLSRFARQPYMPPGWVEAEGLVGGEVLKALIEQGRIVKLGDGVLFTREVYEEAVQHLITYMREHRTITVSEARDILSTSRKYILPLLEHLDVLRITRRLGDERILT
jgi:selenocysteine-specific elongation factor